MACVVETLVCWVQQHLMRQQEQQQQQQAAAAELANAAAMLARMPQGQAQQQQQQQQQQAAINQRLNRYLADPANQPHPGAGPTPQPGQAQPREGVPTVDLQQLLQQLQTRVCTHACTLGNMHDVLSACPLLCILQACGYVVSHASAAGWGSQTSLLCLGERGGGCRGCGCVSDVMLSSLYWTCETDPVRTEGCYVMMLAGYTANAASGTRVWQGKGLTGCLYISSLSLREVAGGPQWASSEDTLQDHGAANHAKQDEIPSRMRYAGQQQTAASAAHALGLQCIGASLCYWSQCCWWG